MSESGQKEVNTEKIHERRLKEVKGDQAFNQEISNVFTDSRLTDQQKSNKAIDRVTGRILYMKNNNRSD